MDNQSLSPSLITNLFIKPEHGAPMQPKDTLEAIPGKGLKGDQAFGRRSRQILIVDQDMLEELKLDPGDLRENVTVQGLPIDTLPNGTRLKSGEVVIEIIDVCDPCEKLEEIRPGLKQASVGMRGMLAIVERGGQLTKGAPISIVQANNS